MAKKFSATEVAAFLKQAVNPKSYDFIIEVIQNPRLKSEYRVRLKGKNGEIVFPGEWTEGKQTAHRLTARLLAGGLKAKVKLIDAPAKPAGKTKPVQYQQGGE